MALRGRGWATLAFVHRWLGVCGCLLFLTWFLSGIAMMYVRMPEVTPGDLSVSFFTNGGAEANENAVKLARLVTGRNKIIARYRSYHGATNGAVTLTGDPRRWAVEPGMPGVVRMFDPYTYRCPAGHPEPCPVCTGAPHLA